MSVNSTGRGGFGGRGSGSASGADGGAAGVGGTSTTTAGGAGGGGAGAGGGAATGTAIGGAGGAGGATATFINTAPIAIAAAQTGGAGTAGGMGGAGVGGYGGGGGGGGGGFGVLELGAGAVTIGISAAVTGGAGGAPGAPNALGASIPGTTLTSGRAGNGGGGLQVDSGTVLVTSTGQVTGGVGGAGAVTRPSNSDQSIGGDGISLRNTSVANVVQVQAGGAVTGGAGGAAISSVGGAGLTGAMLTLSNAGTIAGGATSAMSGQNSAGGYGVSTFGAGSILNTATGQILGGAGNGGYGGNALLSTGGASISNAGLIRGGSGAQGGYGLRIGDATVSNTGTIAGGAGNAQGIALLLQSNNTIANSGAITSGAGAGGVAVFVNGSNDTLALSTADGTGTITGGFSLFSGTLALDPGTASSVTLTNLIANAPMSAGGGIAKVGANTLVLSGANTFTGGTTLTAGTLELASNTALGTGTITFGAGMQTLRIDAGVTVANLISGFGYNEDRFDIRGGPVTAATASGTTLTYSQGGVSHTLTFAAALGGTLVQISDDGAGGSFLMFAPYTYTPPTTPGQTPTPSQAAGLDTQFDNLERAAPGGIALGTPSSPIYAAQQTELQIAAKLNAGQISAQDAQSQLYRLVDGTTSVAEISYAFFTGRTPTQAGLNFLVNSGANPTDLNDAYYTRFSTENRYINFAANLATGQGAGVAAFQAAYGNLSLQDAAAKAYQAVFGITPTADKITAILNEQVNNGRGGTETRAQYLADITGGSAIAQKAAVAGFLLADSVKEGFGTYQQANLHFLQDLAHGTAVFNVDLLAAYGAAPTLVGQPVLDPSLSGS